MTVHIFGNCTIDQFFTVDHFPVAGETLLATSRYTDLGGKGANQAVVVGRCGLQPVFIAPLGADRDGTEARARLTVERLDLTHLLTVGTPTDQSIIYVRPDGTNCIVSSHAAADALTPERCDAALSAVAAGDLVLLQGNLMWETTRHCLATARARGATTVLNPAPIAFDYAELWALVDLAMVNEYEAKRLGWAESALEGGWNLSASGAGRVIVTLGARGAVLIEDALETAVPAPKVEAVDTAGAGDVFCGVVVGALAHGIALTRAIGMAVAAASLAVTRRGTQSSFPSPDELRGILEAARVPGSGIAPTRRGLSQRAGDAS